jgi:hypothetical protein
VRQDGDDGEKKELTVIFRMVMTPFVLLQVATEEVREFLIGTSTMISFDDLRLIIVRNLEGLRTFRQVAVVINDYYSFSGSGLHRNMTISIDLCLVLLPSINQNSLSQRMMKMS